MKGRALCRPSKLKCLYLYKVHKSAPGQMKLRKGSRGLRMLRRRSQLGQENLLASFPLQSLEGLSPYQTREPRLFPPVAKTLEDRWLPLQDFLEVQQVCPRRVYLSARQLPFRDHPRCRKPSRLRLLSCLYLLKQCDHIIDTVEPNRAFMVKLRQICATCIYFLNGASTLSTNIPRPEKQIQRQTTADTDAERRRNGDQC